MQECRPLNLITDPWLPVLRKSAIRDKIAPQQLTETDDPIVAVSSPRPDFDGALWQFLIGLLQTCAPPADDNEWCDWLEKPPLPAKLQRLLREKYLPAFDLDGERGAFMQDFDSKLDGAENNIAQLLIDAPGAQTLKHNTDHFVKRKQVERLCPTCTVMALLTLQINSPSGGSGYRVSVRGGGPLTTLVVSGEEDGDRKTLWHKLWLNVLPSDRFPANHSGKNEPADIFPWLAETRISCNNEKTTPADTHILQMYWGMPRRIRIDQQNVQRGYCDLCGVASEQLLSKYVTKKHGVSYEAWEHCLTPYSCSGKDGKKIPQKGKDSSYRDWLGLVSGIDGKTSAARVVRACQEVGGRRLKDEQFRLYTFGYRMDNMKPLCWHETVFPLFENTPEDFAADVQALIRAAEECVRTMTKCIKNICKIDTSFIGRNFYQDSQDEFFRLVAQLAKGKRDDVAEAWGKVISRVALTLFDYHTMRGNFIDADHKAIVKNKNILCRKLADIKKKLRI